MWRRKNKFERQLDTLETQASEAVGQLAGTIRGRFDNEVGQEVAAHLSQLARRVDELDLSDQVAQRRKKLEKAAKKASRRVDRAIKDLEKTRGKVARDARELASQVGENLEHSGQQIATISQQSVPEKPGGWIMPTLLGLLVGFGLGFFVAKKTSKKESEEH